MKAIVTDLDGTLLTDEKKISEFNTKILNRVSKEKNIEIIVASGRDIYSIKDITKNLNIEYYICFNGAKIYREDKLIYRESMSEEICEDILKEGMRLGLEFSATSQNEIHYTKMDNEYTRLTCGKDSLKFFPLKKIDDIKKRKFEKMVFVGEEKELDILREYAKEKYGNEINIFYSGSKVIDIVNKNCSKGMALKKIIQDLGISSSEVIAFGDNENDISMLEVAGHPVIMENSRPELKKEKYHRTLSNNDNGVGKYVEKILLK